MKIGLLVGGDSPERDVSLSSGKAIHKALELLGNNVIVLDTFNGISSLESKILNVDLIFNGLHGGDGEVQARAAGNENRRRSRTTDHEGKVAAGGSSEWR